MNKHDIIYFFSYWWARHY